MKITPVQPLSASGTKQAQSVKPHKTDFKEVLENQKSNDMFADIQKTQKTLIEGKEISGKDLILYQIKVGQFSMRVELISKMAESAMGTVKKFQNPQ